MVVTFLLTYRSQLAYQRFWEARSNLQMMTARWTDAATSLFIFDDYPVGGFEGFTLEQKKADDLEAIRMEAAEETRIIKEQALMEAWRCPDELHFVFFGPNRRVGFGLTTGRRPILDLRLTCFDMES